MTNPDQDPDLSEKYIFNSEQKHYEYQWTFNAATDFIYVNNKRHLWLVIHAFIKTLSLRQDSEIHWNYPGLETEMFFVNECIFDPI